MSHIGDVLDEADVMARELQRATDDIGKKKSAKISKMCIAIDSRSTTIDANAFAITGVDLR